MIVKSLGTSLAAIALASTTVVISAGTAEAAQGRYFANCTNLANVYSHGVAKSAKAAQKQVRQGYGRPAHGAKARKVYQRNKSRLDRDNDGTACER